MIPPESDTPLPTFDARLFEPPAWANDSVHKRSSSPDSSEHEDERFEDARSDPEELGVEEEEFEVRFTIEELIKLYTRAEALKNEGNEHFKAKPQRIDDARRCYLEALKNLPESPPPEAEPAAGTTAKIVALEDEERDTTHAKIRECTKAVWGNLGAVYVVTEEHKEAVDACTKALEIDPQYVKALQRRASSNEKLGTWSSLTAAQEDYTRLVTLLPPKSPFLAPSKRALTELPKRISLQQEKEKDEMLGKLKELGNGLLGKFGLSTDMFRFDEQPGGGYNLRFQN